MCGWKSKLIFLLIVYFAGFATAIYCLAPVPENQASESGFVNSAIKSDEFALSFNAAMHKCLDFSKDAARRAGGFVQQKLSDRTQTDG